MPETESPIPRTAAHPGRRDAREADFAVVQDAEARARVLARGDEPPAWSPGMRLSRAGMPDEFSEKGRIVRLSV